MSFAAAWIDVEIFILSEVRQRKRNIISYSMIWSMCCAKSLGHVRVFATPWTKACQVTLSMEFSRQAHWSGLPFPSPGELPNPGIKPLYLMSPALSGRFFTTSTIWEETMAYVRNLKKKKKKREIHTNF